MNGHMKVSLPTLRLLLGMLALLLISACSDDGSSSSSSEKELKTKNLYFTSDTSDETRNIVRSFNPKNGEHNDIVKYDKGEHTLITLNTDNDEQGYDKIIYSLDNTIYVMNSEKTEKKLKLASFDDEVCIFPNAIPDQTSFEGSTKGERIFVDHTSVFITSRTDSECDTKAAKIKKINFTDENQITVREVSAAHLWGETLFDFDYKPGNDTNNNDEDDTDPGRYGFLGTNYNTQNGLQLNFYDEESNLIWETSYTAPNSLPTIEQVTQTEVLIQISGAVYVQNIKNLFDINTSSSDNVPTGSKIEALFKEPLITLENTDISELQTASNGSSFALIDDGEIFFYDNTMSAENKFRDLSLSNNTVLDLQIDMMDNGTLLLHRTFPNTSTNVQTLFRYNTTSNTSTSIINVGTDSTIEFQTHDNNIYINTFSPTGWKSLWLNKFFSEENFENSLFAFTKNSRSANAETELFLIASDLASTSDGYLTKPKLYAFDPANKTTGRKQYKKGKDSPFTDFIFGSFTVDVKEVSDSEIFNDVYGKLKLSVVRAISDIASDGSDTYFFNPAEQSSDEIEEPNNALQLIIFEEDITQEDTI